MQFMEGDILLTDYGIEMLKRDGQLIVGNGMKIAYIPDITAPEAEALALRHCEEKRTA